MNDREIENCAEDTSSSVSFNVSIVVENGRLSPEQRKLVASVVSRQVVTLSLQLERIVEGRFHIDLSKRSSAMGTVELDPGMTIDES